MTYTIIISDAVAAEMLYKQTMDKLTNKKIKSAKVIRLGDEWAFEIRADNTGFGKGFK